jgi:16S rRNA C967 or C1407 C5-methylase (RsmB/RsmF family)
VDVNSLEFLSLRFNTPLWLVKMWNKTYGRKLTFKILKANSKAPLKTCRVNTSIIETSEVLAKENLYQKAFIDDMVIYQGNLPFNKQKYLETYHLFQQKMGFKYLVDKLDIDPFKGVAIYQGMSSNFYLEVGLKGHFSIPTDLIFATYQDFYQVKSNIANFKINNVKVYQSSSDSIVTCVSKKVDTFFVLPKSSNFELLRTTPDYFLRFDPKTLDSILSEQYKSLCECSSFVEDEGKLVYLIPTISNKEGRGIVDKFLQEHTDFYLEEERQLFPFDPYDSSLYFAILRKRIIVNND